MNVTGTRSTDVRAAAGMLMMDGCPPLWLSMLYLVYILHWVSKIIHNGLWPPDCHCILLGKNNVALPSDGTSLDFLSHLWCVYIYICWEPYSLQFPHFFVFSTHDVSILICKTERWWDDCFSYSEDRWPNHQPTTHQWLPLEEQCFFFFQITCGSRRSPI